MPALALPAGDTTPRMARTFVSSWLASWGLEHLRDRAELATSELVTNAVEHAGPCVGVLVEIHDHEVLRIAISDTHDSMPIPRDIVSKDDAGDRGLRILNAITDSWGTERIDGDGNTIWCTFALTPPRRPPAAFSR